MPAVIDLIGEPMSRYVIGSIDCLASLVASEKVRNQRVKSFRLIPLHPMGALVEQMKLGVGNELKEQ